MKTEKLKLQIETLEEMLVTLRNQLAAAEANEHSMNYPNLLREDGVSKFPSSKECFLRFFEPSCCIPPQ